MLQVNAYDLVGRPGKDALESSVYVLSLTSSSMNPDIRTIAPEALLRHIIERNSPTPSRIYI